MKCFFLIENYNLVVLTLSSMLFDASLAIVRLGHMRYCNEIGSQVSHHTSRLIPENVTDIMSY